MLAKIRRCTNDDIEAVDSRLYRHASIVHVAADVSQDLGLEAELADGLAILAGLLRGSRRGKLDIIDAKVIESPGDLNLGLGVEEGIGKLLSLTEGRLDYGWAISLVLPDIVSNHSIRDWKEYC